MRLGLDEVARGDRAAPIGAFLKSLRWYEWAGVGFHRTSRRASNERGTPADDERQTPFPMRAQLALTLLRHGSAGMRARKSTEAQTRPTHPRGIRGSPRSSADRGPGRSVLGY